MAMPPRYRPGIGDPAVDAARQRVVEAARSVLTEDREPGAFPMDVVAARAGVARSIVQRQFGTPAGLLEALYDHLIEQSPLARMAKVFELDDRAAMLAAFVGAFAELWQSDRVAFRRLHAYAAFDAVLGAALVKREQYRSETVQVLARRLEAPPQPDRGQRVDVLAALTSFELLDALAGPGRSIDSIVPLALRLIELSLDAPGSEEAER